MEGVVFAFSRRYNVHGVGANLLLLEAGLEQMRHLRLLKIINRAVVSGLYLTVRPH